MNTLYTTPAQSNGLTALNEASLEFRVMKLEERIREMEKTLTTLPLLVREVAMLRQISESCQRELIDHLVETLTVVSSPKQVSEKENAKC